MFSESVPETLNKLSQKRKGGDEEPLCKRRRTRNADSKPEGSQEWKLEDEEDSPWKQIPTGNGESNQRSSEKVPPAASAEHQGRARAKTRVKEFPARNVVTSSSRITFLQSLCKMPKFLSLVEFVDVVVSC